MILYVSLQMLAPALVVLVLPPRGVMMNYGGDEEERGTGEIKIYNARAAAGGWCRGENCCCIEWEN